MLVPEERRQSRMEQRQSAKWYTLPYTVRPAKRYFVGHVLIWVAFVLVISLLLQIPGKTHQSFSDKAGFILVLCFISLLFILLKASSTFGHRLVLLPDRIHYLTLFTRQELLFTDITSVQVGKSFARSGARTWLHLDVRPHRKPLDIVLDDFRKEDRLICYDAIITQSPSITVDKSTEGSLLT